jgi:hypothetical protein
MEHVGFETFYREEHARVLGVVTAVTGRADLAGHAEVSTKTTRGGA